MFADKSLFSVYYLLIYYVQMASVDSEPAHHYQGFLSSVKYPRVPHPPPSKPPPISVDITSILPNCRPEGGRGHRPRSQNNRTGLLINYVRLSAVNLLGCHSNTAVCGQDPL